MDGKDTLISQKRRGPAPTGQGTPVLVRLDPNQLAKLDAFRGDQTRPAAIRTILFEKLGGE